MVCGARHNVQPADGDPRVPHKDSAEDRDTGLCLPTEGVNDIDISRYTHYSKLWQMGV